MNVSSKYMRDGKLILRNQVELPEVLDILIAGGGPGGAGLAFRAKELKLSALVIDYDDLMKQIRDYPKNKKILPDYGVGDKSKFPKCGDLIARLPFEPIDKDELCERWKGFYREHSVPAQIGLELTDLQRQADGIWNAKVYNGNTKTEEFLRARHVVLAMGNGAPRAFDIPGNAKDLIYRLDDAKSYAGAPALVIGSGTSAAEAVIAISKAKMEGGDTSAVYWSYRSNNLPKVSQALADEFFSAFMKNGNIRTCPSSEVVAVVSGEDQREYLSLRTDRRSLLAAGRPNETAHLEFPKASCVACVGQEIPESFLNKLGIPLMTGPNNKKRLVVTPLYESQQPNVYLLGSMLGQVYLQTEDFRADPATFREKKTGGNIKAALTDGVIVAEIIKQKIEGRRTIQVEVQFYEAAPEEKEKSRLLPMGETMLGEAPLPELEEAPQAYLVLLAASDEMEVARYAIKSFGSTTMGRKEDCDISFRNDTTLAERHASISSTADGYFLRDDGSRSGILLKLRPMQWREVVSGDVAQLGRQFLVFRVENGNYAFTHYDAAGQSVKRYALKEGTVELGRAASIVLDGNDQSLSRRHLAVALQAGKVSIQDLKSANGSSIKIRNAVRLEADDHFRIGQQLLKFVVPQEEKSASIIFQTPGPKPPVEKPPVLDEVLDPLMPPEEPVAPPPPKPKPAPLEAAGDKPGALEVVFKNRGKTCPITKLGIQSICKIAEDNGVKIKADCHEGDCGSDPIRIIAGMENLNEASGIEQVTLEDKLELKPGEYRLACMAIPKGRVVVEILDR